ncbi:peptidase S10, serine carboxypeptidase [Dendrothele bispora CBS 962.96]|uniref:Carboxypeptidase n=1 Tax=Dendrothele bispora (strain CBS 962.96) TaxID=1314807 RepID=A0A4S8KWT0_DENBC|nr:peptidase S10, serine carboxypeptidase [Dendrothele bispora CBS 962.96]
MALFSVLVGLLGLVFFLPGVAGSTSVQQPFQSWKNANTNKTEVLNPNVPWSEDNGPNSLFTPLGSLSVLKEHEYTTIAHPLFPKYSARIKKSDFCDPTVNVYTGYLDVGAKHLFFYFFESRNDPAKDDVIFWTNGGPGCSSSLGLLFELGPCRVLDDSGAKLHPDSWNTNASIFFVDQPIGVGFSYADYGETVDTSEEAAKDIAAFVSIFFENFNQFKGRAFHMAGESYGGRYIPLFASAIYDQNPQLVQNGFTPINLTSVMIGNGLTDRYTMFSAYYEMACTSASLPPVLDIKTCVTMKQAISRCEKWTRESCIEQYDPINCNGAVGFCSSAVETPYLSTGLNPYDISIFCRGDLDDECYPETRYMRQFLDDANVRTKIGVDSSITTNFTSCSSQVKIGFFDSYDTNRPETPIYVSGLLERGVRVLIYVGDLDWLCNWIGNEKWTLALEWNGKAEFANTPLREWKVNGKRAGRTRSAGKFTFATVEGAGHAVPYYKPKESLQMVQRWLAGEDL